MGETQRELFPEGYYNLGVAHGVPGVIGLAAVPSIGRAASIELGEGAVNEVVGLAQHFDRRGLAAPRVAQDQPGLDGAVPDIPLQAEARVGRLPRLDR